MKLGPHKPDLPIVAPLQFPVVKYLFIQIPFATFKHLVTHKPYKHALNNLCESGKVLSTLFHWILVTVLWSIILHDFSILLTQILKLREVK